MSQSEHQKAMTNAYNEASKRLRHLYAEDFHKILEQVYSERGIVVRKRLTGERKKLADLEKARALLASHGEI